MDKETFKQHLQEASNNTVTFTDEFCYNVCPVQYKYRMTPSGRTVGKNEEHLTGEELAVLRLWNKYENKDLSAKQVIDLLWHDYKMPVWIDITVYEAGPDYTVFDLFCSRRSRMEYELYYPGPAMPFHTQVVMPPDHLKTEQEGRFDVNWRKRWDEQQGAKGIVKKVLNFFKT